MAAALLLLRLALLLVVAHAEPQLQLPAHPGLGVRGAALLLSQRGVQLPPPTSLDSGNGSSWVSPPEGEHAVSALRLLEDWRDATTGLFEFLIVWPGIHINGMVAHNRWFQRSNPLTTHHVSDYSAHVVLAPYSTAYTQPAPFAGLFRGKRDCLLFGGDDGSFCVAYSGPGTKSGEGGRRTLAWPGFQVTPVVTPLERHDRVTWTELWVVNARGAAVRPAPPPLPPAPPPLPDDMGAAVYEGFDVILVIGQSNSVGYGKATGDWERHDDTSGFPIYVLHAATEKWPFSYTKPMLTLSSKHTQSFTKHIPTSFGGFGENEFSLNFTKHYVLRGFLKPNRALLIVHAGSVVREGLGTALASWFKPGTPVRSLPMPAPPNAAVIQTWAPSGACLPALPAVATASSFEEANLTMSLLTHALYRTDMALSLDPATGRNHSADLLSRFPGNRLAAVLWHQGEEDSGVSIKRWGGCLSELITVLRDRYQQGPQAGEVIPFLGGDLCPFLGGGRDKAAFYKKSFAQGRYPAGWQTGSLDDIPSVNLSTGTAMLGFADSFQEFSGEVWPTPCNGAHFDAIGLQIMGRRYADAYAALFRARARAA